MARHAVRSDHPVIGRAATSVSEDDWQALHPMHRRLVSEFEFQAPAAASWSPAARLGAVFYLGLATWLGVAGTAWAVARIL